MPYYANLGQKTGLVKYRDLPAGSIGVLESAPRPHGGLGVSLGGLGLAPLAVCSLAGAVRAVVAFGGLLGGVAVARPPRGSCKTAMHVLPGLCVSYAASRHPE